MIVLFCDLLLQFGLLTKFLDFGVFELLIQNLEILLGVSRLCYFIRLLGFLLFVFNLCFHLAALLLKHHKLLVLDLHGLFVLTLLELQLAKMLLRHPQFLVHLRDFHIVLSFFVQIL